MALVVQKYGGSSLANPDSIKRIAKRIVAEHKSGDQIVVVVSAMGDTTDHLVQMAHQVSDTPPEREMDMLLSVGERISIALLAMAIESLGINAISFTGSQVGIITDDRHTEARILEIRCHRILEELERGKIVVVAGFQGVSVTKEITTLGRGGSDTTAIALAVALKADRCEFMKDVDGVYVAEPKVVSDSRLNEQISYDSMIEMANMGAGVLKAESVEMAKKFKMKIAVGSSDSGKVGTIITDYSLDSSSIDGIVSQKDLAYVRASTENSLQTSALLEKMAERRIKIQAFLHNGEISELVVGNKFMSALKDIFQEIAAENDTLQFETEENQAIVAIVGNGLNFDSRIAEKIFRTSNQLEIETKMLQVTELRISWLVPEDTADETVRRLHQELTQ
jgi:aspartate kinase